MTVLPLSVGHAISQKKMVFEATCPLKSYNKVFFRDTCLNQSLTIKIHITLSRYRYYEKKFVFGAEADLGGKDLDLLKILLLSRKLYMCHLNAAW